VYELEVLRRGWRKLHIKELHNLHCFPNIIRVIKSRMMIKMDLNKNNLMVWTASNCPCLGSRWWALVNVVINLQVP
jgi:hypothetical protein